MKLLVADAVRTASGLCGDAVLVDGGAVVGVGASDQLGKPGIEIERFRGVLIPGLRDAHFHPVGYTAALTGLTLKDASDLGEVRGRLQEQAASLAPGEPLVAMRLDDETLAEHRFPSRVELDEWLGDRPVLVHRYCGHVAVANTAALHLAHIGKGAVPPPGGNIDLDDRGFPTGVLRETAVDTVAGALPPGTPIGAQQLIDAMRGLAGLGLTSIGAMAGCGDGLWASLGDEIALLAEVGHDLPIHLRVMVIANDQATLEASADKLRSAGPMVSFLGLKRFADGSLGGHTAAMYEPFTDNPATSGTVRLEQSDLALARHAARMDATVAIHAIGDAATGSVLDVMETLIDEGADPDRLRIEHASVVTPGDVSRFAGTQVIASVQPAFLGSETDWLPARVGAERLERTYPFRSLVDAGARLAGGSDCPVEPPNPFMGMALARDRAGIVPTQSLRPEEALALFTDWAALAIGEDPPLMPGASADLVLLDRDPVSSSPDELRETSVVATWVGGERVSVDHDWVTWRS